VNKDFHCDAILDVGNNDVMGVPFFFQIALLGFLALQRQGEGWGEGEGGDVIESKMVAVCGQYSFILMFSLLLCLSTLTIFPLR